MLACKALLSPQHCRLVLLAAALLLGLPLLLRALLPPPLPTPKACGAWLDAHYPLLSEGAAQRALHNVSAAAGTAGAPSDALQQLLPFYDLVVVVPSVASAAGRARRDSVRSAFSVSAGLVPWARVKLLFVLAPVPAPALAWEGAAAEMAQQDVLRAPGCADDDGSAKPTAGSATTCKVLAALAHVAAQYRCHFVARIGDDAHFRLDQFLSRVAPAHVAGGRRGANLVMAYWSRSTQDNPSNNVEEAFQRAAYGVWAFPRYPHGMGYVFSGSVARSLARVHAEVGLADGFPEDGVVGLWVAGLSTTSVARVDSPCFANVEPRVFGVRGCRDEAILVHYMTPWLWGQVNGQGRLPFCAF